MIPGGLGQQEGSGFLPRNSAISFPPNSSMEAKSASHRCHWQSELRYIIFGNSCVIEIPPSTTLTETLAGFLQIIQGLGLNKVGNNVVGTVLKRGLSGGEKRRVTVGQELVIRQAVAFLDEPTSGLDGTAAYDVIKVTATLDCMVQNALAMELNLL